MPDTPSPDTPAPQRPSGRGSQTSRDMLLSLAALLVVIFAVLGFGRMCSFSPGGPAVDTASAPTVNVDAELRATGAGVDFDLRQPKLPTGWRANSADTTTAGSGDKARPVIRVGWLTPSGAYLRLSQSQAEAGDLAASETDSTSNPAVAGEIVVNGTHWTVYPARRSEKSWLAEVSGVRMLISGSATEAEFRTLAEAAQTGTVVPKNR